LTAFDRLLVTGRSRDHRDKVFDASGVELLLPSQHATQHQRRLVPHASSWIMAHEQRRCCKSRDLLFQQATVEL
jgi:hypothetical protein